MTDPGRLEGRAAVVTGGGRGAGAAIARMLAASGASVLVAARTTGEVETVAAALRATGGLVYSAYCDVTNTGSVRELSRQAQDSLGRCDILVNNAGMSMAAPLARTTLDDWNATIAVNATGAFLCMPAFLPGMMERGWAGS